MNSRSRVFEWLAGIVAAFGVGTLIWTFFAIKICDEQLAGSGAVLQVCRHPQLSDPPVVAIGVIVMVALGYFFSEISGFGISLKRSVEAANRTAEEAVRTADEAKETLREVEQDVREGVGEALAKVDRDATDLSADPIKRLAAKYNEIRWTMPAGSRRTAAMSDVVREMIAALRDVKAFDMRTHLHSADSGLQLAGIAYLHASPDPKWTADLVAGAVHADSKPFNEYWALLSMRRLLEGHCDALDGTSRLRLQHRLAELSATSDRGKQIKDLLRMCP